jgi:hypothetical protein
MTLETLKSIVAENYDELKDPSALFYVGNFLSQNPVPGESPFYADMDTLFIKRLTKVVSHAYALESKAPKGFHFPQDVLAAAADYCREGIARIVSGAYLTERLSRDEHAVSRMHGHFHTHAARFEEERAAVLSDKEAHKHALSTAVLHYAEGISIASRVDPENLPYCYRNRGETLHRLASLVEPVQARGACELSAQDALKAASLFERIDCAQAGFLYTLAADRFYEAVPGTDAAHTKHLLDSAIDSALKGIALIKEVFPERTAITHGNTGKFYDALFQLTCEDEARSKAIHHYRKTEDYFKYVPDPDKKAIRTVMRLNIQRLQRENAPESAPLSRKETGKKKSGREKSRSTRHIAEELAEEGY